jgi:hypothetical protein
MRTRPAGAADRPARISRQSAAPPALIWIRDGGGASRAAVASRWVVALVEMAAGVFGDVTQPREIVKHHSAVAESQQLLLAQLPQPAVDVDRGEAQRIGQTILAQRAVEAGPGVQAGPPVFAERFSRTFGSASSWKHPAATAAMDGLTKAPPRCRLGRSSGRRVVSGNRSASGIAFSTARRSGSSVNPLDLPLDLRCSGARSSRAMSGSCLPARGISRSLSLPRAGTPAHGRQGGQQPPTARGHVGLHPCAAHRPCPSLQAAGLASSA